MDVTSLQPTSVNSLALVARSCSLEEFSSRLGDPLATLVGPAKMGSEAWAFVTRVTAGSSAALDAVELGEQLVYPIPRPRRAVFNGAIFVGRASSNEVSIDDESISKIHAKLEHRDEGRFRVEDQRSRNGTAVRGALLLPSQSAILSPRETVQFGGRMFRLYPLDSLYRLASRVVPPSPALPHR